MIKIGYDSGLSLQAMPYNFFYGLFQNEFNLNFEPSLERLHKLTGKKTTIIAHSFGNLVTLFNLSKMDKTKKENLVSNWVAASPPFLGSTASFQLFFEGDKELIFMHRLIGLEFRPFRKIAENQMSYYQVMQQDEFELYKDEEWFKKIQ